MKVYYAHPISLYNTEQERRDLELLEALGLEVENPNSSHHQEAYRAHGMNHFMGVIDTCDALAFRAFADGSIPAGVYAEVDYADVCGSPIIELPSALRRRSLTVEETSDALEDMGHR